MADSYYHLLDATTRHLQELKLRGAKNVVVSPETLRMLSQPGATGIQTHSFEPQLGGKTAADARPAPATTAGPRKTDSVVAATGRKEPVATVTPPSPKAAAFASLRERVAICVKCAHLAASRKNVVFGVGNIDAQLMFVGEAPGADEDARGEPFVGRAGELLTKIIQAMGLNRTDVYIANILKCRPDTPGQASGNRKPKPDEMATCIPYLHEQIDLIQPKVIVALGVTAVDGLLGPTGGIMKIRGQWKTYRGTPLMPTFHPAFLLRNQAMGEKRKVWEDMLAVMERLEMPISEKQRNYFTRAA